MMSELKKSDLYLDGFSLQTIRNAAYQVLNGNKLFNKGDFSDALDEWDKGTSEIRKQANNIAHKILVCELADEERKKEIQKNDYGWHRTEDEEQADRDKLDNDVEAAKMRMAANAENSSKAEKD